MQNKPYAFATAIIISMLFLSCASRKDVVYFQDAGNFETQVNTNTFESRFKVDDLVSIYISSLNPEASSPFNLTMGAIDGTRAVGQQVEYLVDQAGEIDFPVIGKLKIQGLTPDELRNLLRARLSEYLKDPIINIQLRNFSVTVLGEVRSPGTFLVGGEQISILEALGLAGDLTIRGVRDNVLVVRDFNGTKIYTRIDLTTKNMAKSPVYYLTQNDVVYVEPNNAGVSASNVDANTKANITISLVSILITSAVVLLTRN